LNSQTFVYVNDIVESLLGKGIVSVPEGVFDRFNPNYYELVRTINNQEESEQLAESEMITLVNLGSRIEEEMDAVTSPNLRSSMSVFL